MIKIILIVATDHNNVIGNAGKLLWHLPIDLTFFKNQTWGMPILMGRKTFNSINNTILKGRLNIIITKNTNFKAANVFVVHDLQEAINYIKKKGYKELFIVGGAEIYNLAMPFADQIIRTKVDAYFTGDTNFSGIDENKFTKIADRYIAKNEKNIYNIIFEWWERKK